MLVTANMTPADWKASGQLIECAGHQLFLRDSGEPQGGGDTLLLIHGFPTASWDWHHQWDALAKRYRVVAFDMLGFGFSDKPRGHCYSIHEQADLHESVMLGLGLSHCNVLAHDYGDTVAQELLARAIDNGPLTLQSVCLLNGGLFPETHRARLAQKLLLGPFGSLFTRLMGRGSLARNMQQVFGGRTPPSAATLDAFWQLITHNNGRLNMHRLMQYIANRRTHRERWLTALQNAPCPLGLIVGMADPVSGEHMVARYRELVGHGHIVELEGVGHYPQIEVPDVVRDEVLSFLAKHDSRAA